jgi:hypothetical protein
MHAQSGGASGVKVDFRVMNAEGQPVRDLKAEEVTLRVDGKPRQIRSLDLVDLTSAAGGASVTAPSVPPPYTSNVGRGGAAARDVLFLFDEESVAPGREGVLREAAEQLITAFSERDRVGMASVRQGGPSAGISGDRSGVRAGLAKLAGYSSGKETGADLTCRTARTVQNLQSIFGSFAGGNAAIIVFLSTNVAALQSGQTARLGQESGSGLCQLRLEDFNRLGAAANASRASFYVVELTEALAVGAPPEASGGLENLAGSAGGELVRLSGSGEAQMARIARDTSVYYIATFEPEAAERTGTNRRVDLRVGREGVRVRTRPEITIAKAQKMTPRDMIRVANPFLDLPLRAAAFSSRNTGDGKIKVIALFEPAESGVALGAAMVGLFDEKGKLTAQWTADRDELTRRTAMAALAAPPGKYRMRVAATDSSGRSGAVDVDILAALVSVGSVQLSDLVLGTTGEAGAPTLQFQDEDQAVAMVELYGRPTKPLKAYIEVLPSLEGERIEAAALAPSATSEQDRFILSAGVSLGTLAPGDYIVRATVAVEGEPEGQVMHTLRKAKAGS